MPRAPGDPASARAARTVLLRIVPATRLVLAAAPAGADRRDRCGGRASRPLRVARIVVRRGPITLRLPAGGLP